MRRPICTLALVLGAAHAAAAQTTPAPPDSARADSLARADSIAALRELQGAPATRDTTPGAVVGGGPANRLLPDISAVGDFIADLSPDRSTQEDQSRFGIREVEIAVQAAVDPYFRGDVFLGISDLEGVSIEQAYLTTTSLPYAVEARLGRFLMPFGKQNTTHRHDLHTTEYPYVIQRFFGAEGLNGTGVYASRTFAPFGFFQEVQVTAVDRLGRPADGLVTSEPLNRKLGGLGYSARLRNYVDLSQSRNVELGFSAITGRVAQPAGFPSDPVLNAVAVRQTTLGADLTYRWRPLQQGLYRSLIVQAEVMHQMNGDPDRGDVAFNYTGPDRDATGGYVFGRYQLGQRLFLGARGDYVQTPYKRADALRAGSGYLEFFPSEFSKLSAGYERVEPSEGSGYNRILLQATFSLGPHKPHPF